MTTARTTSACDPRIEALILPVRDGADGILVGVVREQFARSQVVTERDVET